MKTRNKIKLGSVEIGGNSPVSIQSMTNTDTRDTDITLEQIRKLRNAGCEIIRVAVPDFNAAEALNEICSQSPIPVIADIHFNADLALESIKNGADGIRLNPGNIKDDRKLEKTAKFAEERKIPIRVGANSGSFSSEYLRKVKTADDKTAAVAEALCDSALMQCRCLEKYGFSHIKVALKSSNVPAMVKANRRFAEITDYPLHLGVTEAGTLRRGVIKSTAGIASLLLDGIGDTIRVSLTADPIEEVKTAKMILETCGLREAHPEIVSCPTCGRIQVDVIRMVEKLENLVEAIKVSGKKISMRKIAVMGCAVNGPGEARDADIGISGTEDGRFLLFIRGKSVGFFKESEILEQLRKNIR